MKSITQVIEENKQYLTDLDAAIGDGDHGINMAKGFRAAQEKLEAAEPSDVESVIKTVAMALISNVGGASGPLYGTLFLKASSAVKGKIEIGMDDFDQMLQAGIEGVKQRGKSTEGEKTMLDVLVPVEAALSKGLQEGLSTAELLSAMTHAAEAGVAYTKTIAATKGRAS